MKSLNLYIGTLVLVLFFSSFSYANSDLVKPAYFEVGYELTSFYYEEPGVMDEEGILNGLEGRFTVHTLNNIMWSIIGRFSAGSLDYDGETWGGSPLTMDTDVFVFSFSGLVGRDFYLGNSLLTPLVGFGYRYWKDDSSSNVGGYAREIKYIYSPIGFETASPAWENWLWGLKAEYDLFWGGKVTSHLSDAVSGLSDADNKQGFGDGYGVNGSLYLKNIKDGGWPVSIEIFVRYWDIEESNITPITYYGWLIGYGVEPANKTSEYGLKLSLFW